MVNDEIDFKLSCQTLSKCLTAYKDSFIIITTKASDNYKYLIFRLASNVLIKNLFSFCKGNSGYFRRRCCDYGW